MGVYIPNMEMPKKCDDCPFCGYDERQSILFCRVDNEDIEQGLRDDCPLIDIVTCGECIHHDDDGWGYGNCQRPSVDYLRTADNDFCSYGERRSDEHTD